MQQLSIKKLEMTLFDTEELSVEDRDRLEKDPRKGVQNLLKRWDRIQEKKRHMRLKYEEMLQFERKQYEQGIRYISGIDEAGRGPLAGPVVAAAVILKPNSQLYGINDSKQLSKSKRDYFFQWIKEEAVSIGVGIVTAKEIDQINIYQAAKKAMSQAVDNLDLVPEHLLIDAMTLSTPIPQTSLIKGDARSISIAAASVIAKVTRDKMMEEMDEVYPGYGFSHHAGYGTKEHLEAIKQLGPCPEHRLTFAPLQSK
ncbi:ribonuclease HII [Terrilactibacillus sp. BCM23-1]|uniref:Ribonuclease HII n=1 Tax=Terrilactibacillus tamarindi TaxID=2599694 RepID=A0A6N8CQ84_9BACI|nr:ribonuclease HII [Terrilactibacillus tamarindi]MTT32294.1 ribonuclease HII [Terrilactibacillus tamarindi]